MKPYRFLYSPVVILSEVDGKQNSTNIQFNRIKSYPKITWQILDYFLTKTDFVCCHYIKTVSQNRETVFLLKSSYLFYQKSCDFTVTCYPTFLTLSNNYKCSTLSLISCVLPWFQYWVPIYPQVLLATFILFWSRFLQFGHSHNNLSCSSFTI